MEEKRKEGTGALEEVNITVNRLICRRTYDQATSNEFTACERGRNFAPAVYL